MKLSSVVKAFGSLCLLLADGFPVSEYGSPEIIGTCFAKVKAKPGEPLLLNCEALTHSDDMTLIYWLINGLFPEETSSDDRIVETQESTLENGTILQRSLLLKNVTSEDLKSTFNCVVTNTFGMAKKFIKLRSGDCVARQKRKD